MDEIFLALIDVLASADRQRVEELQKAVAEYGVRYPRSMKALKQQRFAANVLDAIESADVTEEMHS